MASPRGCGYPLIPDSYPVRTWSVPVGYLLCQTGYLPTQNRVPVRIGPCRASMSGPWQRVPGSAYLPMQQVGRLWTQHLEASHSNRSQPLPPVAKNGLDTVFGHDPSCCWPPAPDTCSCTALSASPKSQASSAEALIFPFRRKCFIGPARKARQIIPHAFWAMCITMASRFTDVNPATNKALQECNSWGALGFLWPLCRLVQISVARPTGWASRPPCQTSEWPLKARNQQLSYI
jgi:hypothetical protein